VASNAVQKKGKDKRQKETKFWIGRSRDEDKYQSGDKTSKHSGLRGGGLLVKKREEGRRRKSSVRAGKDDLDQRGGRAAFHFTNGPLERGGSGRPNRLNDRISEISVIL